MSAGSPARSPLAVPFPAMPAIAGVEMAAGRAGLYPRQRDDLLLMRFAPGTACAGVFTRHRIGSAPVDWCQTALAGGGGARALVANAGCANSFTGEAGAAAARATAVCAAGLFDVAPAEVMLASTGVIGVRLDAAKVTRALPDLAGRLDPDRWEAAARAIMTTDTFAKGACARTEIAGTPVAIAGIAKGSGMIAPEMATMLAFVATDAAIGAGALQALLSRAVADTFNAVTVDGDRSTNDTALLFATARAPNPRIDDPADPRLVGFADALHDVLLDLAQQLVRDGEGASKFIRIAVTGAASDASARKIARTVAESPLVKTAFAGEDANWGRIVMAVGRADEPVARERLAVLFGPHAAARDGRMAADYSEEALSAYMKNAELEVAIDIGIGAGAATMWTCDLTRRYVEINGDYRS